MKDETMILYATRRAPMTKQWETMTEDERLQYMEVLRTVVSEENKMNLDRFIRDLCISMPDNDVARDKNAFISAWIANPCVGRLTVKQKGKEKPVVAVNGYNVVTASHMQHYFKVANNAAMYNAFTALVSALESVHADVVRMKNNLICADVTPSTTRAKGFVEDFAQRFNTHIVLRSQDVRYLMAAITLSAGKVNADTNTLVLTPKNFRAFEPVIIQALWNAKTGVKYSVESNGKTVKLTDADKRTYAIITGTVE